jgi:hypothetical protein
MHTRYKPRYRHHHRRDTRRNHKLIRESIQAAYRGIEGYGGDDDYKEKYDTTYGEITLAGIEKLIHVYRKTYPISKYPSGQRTFYDLGSGIGKNVMMVAGLVPELHAKGIEIVKDRHDKAMSVYHKYKSPSKARITFINGSLYDYSIDDAAWIFISNLCFSQDMNNKLVSKIEKEAQPNTLIACSVQLPCKNTSNIHFLQNVIIPMTWNSDSAVYLYKKL